VLGSGPAFVERLATALAQTGGLPTVTIEYRDVHVEADALVGADRTPSVWNSTKALVKSLALKRLQTRPLTILDGVSGVIKPGRLTLLLGPPGSGKSVLLQHLSGRLRTHRGLRASGSIKYNGVEVDEFVPRRTAGLVGQYDNHIPDMTVMETVKFAGECQMDAARAATTLANVDKALIKAASQKASRKAFLPAASGRGLASVVEEGDDGEDMQRQGSGTAAVAAAVDEAADEELHLLEMLK
jgi:ABC-type sugar transport system ATPase subunit